MSEHSDAGAMPNTPSAYRLWPQHALSEPSHALGLPSSHTWQPSGDAPAALSEPRHTLGLPLSYKRSPLQASYAMPSACVVVPDAIHVCPTSSMPYTMAGLPQPCSATLTRWPVMPYSMSGMAYAMAGIPYSMSGMLYAMTGMPRLELAHPQPLEPLRISQYLHCPSRIALSWISPACPRPARHA